MPHGDVMTCPKCGALVVPQLERCRQCDTYLQGTAVEGALMSLLPGPLREAPGTAAAVLFIALYYGLAVALAGPRSIPGFTGYTLRAMGALGGPELVRGEHWRFVTYMFGHHDLVHLAFNLSALFVAGPIVEQIFERRKMLLAYVMAGVAGGLVSLAWYSLRGDGHRFFVSAGASGAVSGMIGAALIGARRLGPDGRDLADRMWKWTVSLMVWGLLPGINNAAHLGGFVVGAICARAFRPGIADARWKALALSVTSLATLAGIVICTGFMVRHARGFPVAFEKDGDSRRMLGMTWDEGTPFEDSAQTHWTEKCAEHAQALHPDDDDVRACELAFRLSPESYGNVENLALLLDRRGDRAEAARMRRVAAWMGTPIPTEVPREAAAPMPLPSEELIGAAMDESPDEAPPFAGPRGTWIALAYMGNGQGEFESCGCPKQPLGGLARRATLIEALRREADGVIVVSAGDDLSSPLLPREIVAPRARLIADAYLQIGLDAYAPGELDRDKGGGEKLLDMRDRIVERGGVRVGLLVADLTATPPPKLDERAKSLKSGGARIVVAVLHGPRDAASVAVEQAGAAIDIAVVAHTGLGAPKLDRAGIAWLVEAPLQGTHLGQLDLHFIDGKPGFSLVPDAGNWLENQSIPLGPEILDEPKVAALVARYKAEVGAKPQ